MKGKQVADGSFVESGRYDRAGRFSGMLALLRGDDAFVSSSGAFKLATVSRRISLGALSTGSSFLKDNLKITVTHP